MQIIRAGLFTSFLATIMYIKAAIAIRKNLIIKLPYKDLMEELGFGELIDFCEI